MDTQTTKPVGSRRANIKDVAAALNVAVSTVSNAYNRPDQLSAALRQRVLDTADRLGYPGPNPMARGLRTRSSGTIVVLLGQPLASAFADPITAGTLEGITDALSESGLALQLVPSDARSGLPAADGVLVLCPDRDDPLLGQVIRHGQPTVLVDHPAEGFLTSVRADDEMAARGAIGHLTGLGHTRIGIIIDRIGVRRDARIHQSQEESGFILSADGCEIARISSRCGSGGSGVGRSSGVSGGREFGRCGNRCLERAARRPEEDDCHSVHH